MFKIKRFLVLFLLVLTACSAGGSAFPAIFASSTPIPPTSTPLPPTATSIPPALTVNGEEISVDEFNAEVSRYKTAMTAQGINVNDEQAIQVVREDIISQLLLAEAAVEAGFVMDEAASNKRRDALISRIGGADKLTSWEQAHGFTDESFNEALKRAAASAWMRDKITSSIPVQAEQVHVRQILLYNEAVAKSYYDQLQAGTNFDQLAARVDPITIGDIGWFPHNYLTEKSVEDAAFSLEVGAYSAIIPSEIGFHILKLIERQPNRVLSPDALLVLQARGLNDWLTSRRQKSSIAP